MDRLEQMSATKNWQVVNVPADGHCMFSSLAVQLGHPVAVAQDIKGISGVSSHPSKHCK